MKFKVIQGLRSATDPNGKPRFAVILKSVIFEDEEWVHLLPCTTYPQRTNITPEGSVLLTSKSPAYRGTGFTAEKIAISLRDAAIYRKKSGYLEGSVEVGTLNLSKDNRLRDEWQRTRQATKDRQPKCYED